VKDPQLIVHPIYNIVYNKVHSPFRLSTSPPSGIQVKQSYRHGIRNREAPSPPIVSGGLLSNCASEVNVKKNADMEQLTFEGSSDYLKINVFKVSNRIALPKKTYGMHNG